MPWKATYSDDTFLMQFEGDKENSYKDIDRSKLSSFAILGDGGELILSVKIERPTQQLIYRKRTFYTPFATKQYTYVYMVGWHENIGGKSIKSICYLYEDGHIEMAGAKDDIELIGCEKEEK